MFLSLVESVEKKFSGIYLCKIHTILTYFEASEIIYSVLFQFMLCSTLGGVFISHTGITRWGVAS
jgi:hypothetical protein